MASSKQIAANRANAKKSTGPKSSDGKARSKRNAVTHGLTGTEIVVAQEEPEQFEAFRLDLMADLAPESLIEREFVDRLAGLLWRLRRVPVLEAELFNAPGPSEACYNLANLNSDELKQLAALLRKAGVVNVPPPRLEDVKGQDVGEKPMDKLAFQHTIENAALLERGKQPGDAPEKHDGDEAHDLPVDAPRLRRGRLGPIPIRRRPMLPRAELWSDDPRHAGESGAVKANKSFASAHARHRRA